jgi:hypothetical protein
MASDQFAKMIQGAVTMSQADELDVGKMTGLERSTRKNVVARIPIFQSNLSYDFLGIQV